MKKSLRVAVVGAGGRMGQAVCGVAAEEGVNVEVKIDCDDPMVLAGADVVIDFSSAAAADALCAAALRAKKPLVIGTTGHLASQRRAIEKAAETIPIVLASNFSVGVNALFALTEHAAKILGDSFDLEIVEVHHRMKKDAPSGTAKTLAEILQRARKLKKLRYGREGVSGVRDAEEIGLHAVRGGDVVGEHTVIFAGNGERLELTHRATSRVTFARGAVRAAYWVASKTPGLYDMRDVLGL